MTVDAEPLNAAIDSSADSLEDLYQRMAWVTREACITDADGGVVFRQEDVEAPAAWSQSAINIVASKYFHGQLGTPEREHSVKQLVRRVVDTIVERGAADKYFDTAAEATAFSHQLAALVLEQKASFNSPVWFNVGVKSERRGSGWCHCPATGTEMPVGDQDKPQCSACFIISVEDSLASILDLVKTEGMLFKWGSGAGSNLSNLREQNAPLSGGGKASGPLSFMKGLDAFAGVIKSGSKARRAAKVVILNADHPDIEQFVACKVEEEKKAHALIAAGYDGSFEGEAYRTIAFQNANNSVRVTDDFMAAACEDRPWALKSVVGGQTVKTLPARGLLRQIAEATHQCGDPGMQFDTTINRWHTCQQAGRVNASNPCCFVGETFVDTSEGRIPFSVLESMYANHVKLPLVFAYDVANREPVLRQINRVWVAGMTDRIAGVRTQKGLVLRCTPDHPFLTHRTGEYVCAENLRAGTPLRKIGRGINAQRSDRRYIYSKVTKNSPKGCAYQSRWMWEQVNGPIPEGFEVHHKNEDPTDDRLSNFELVKEATHQSLHASGEANARYLELPDNTLVEVWESIERLHKTVTVGRWNGYVTRMGLSGVVPKANTMGIRGLSWEDFSQWIDERRPVINDRVLSVELITLETPVAVYDMEIAGVHNFSVSSDTTSLHSLVVHNSEFMFLDDSACNLASLNLLKFVDSSGVFEVSKFKQAVDTLITAQEILVDNASYPTEKIARNTHNYRPLGLGFANLGALLMTLGLPYDSQDGRNLAAAITSLMTAQAYDTSAKLAQRKGPFAGYEARDMFPVINQHREAARLVQESPISREALRMWESACASGETYGFRNAQVTLIAPTGTISFILDCDTTGIEPELALVKYKKLIGGGTMKIVNQAVPAALRKLGFRNGVIPTILEHIAETGTIEGAFMHGDETISLSGPDLAVFDCSLRPENGKRSIPYMGHIRMMAAVQPFISGAISKTINMPADSTVEDVMDAYIESWKLGLKAVAIYRDGSKGIQPVSTGAAELKTQDTAGAIIFPADLSDTEPLEAGNAAGQLQTAPARQSRRPLPKERAALTRKFSVSGHEGYATVGLYDDETPGELFVTMAKEGSTISGLMDTFAIAISHCLQWGVPLQFLIDKFKNVRFEPSGWTGDKDIPYAKSIVDFIFQWLEKKFPNEDVSAPPPVWEEPLLEARPAQSAASDAPLCSECGALMVPSGKCHACRSCGSTSGCS